jgi:conjugal transfer pilus assembly protein TraW
MKTTLLILTALLIAAPFSFAQNADEDWLSRSKAIMADPQSYATVPTVQGPNKNHYGSNTKKSDSVSRKPEPLSREDINDSAPIETDMAIENIAAEIGTVSRDLLLKAFLDQEERPLEIVILITFGSPVETEHIRGLLQSLTGENVTLAIQGLPVGYTKVDKTALLMASLQKGIESPPGLVIDPRFFEKTGSTLSPTIVVQQGGEPLLWASGVSDPDWILRRYHQGDRGNLGIYGTTEKVAEKNFKQEIAERLARINWEEKKDEATHNFWKSYPYIDLPVATRFRAFEFELSYLIDKDITGKDGQVLARAGQKINPVSIISGSFYLVVFDATDPKQILLAKEIGTGAPKGKRVKYLATKLNFSEDGWEEKSRIENLLDAPLYFISLQQSQILHLKKIPASVETSGQLVRVTEYPLEK